MTRVLVLVSADGVIQTFTESPDVHLLVLQEQTAEDDAPSAWSHVERVMPGIPQLDEARVEAGFQDGLAALQAIVEEPTIPQVLRRQARTTLTRWRVSQTGR